MIIAGHRAVAIAIGLAATLGLVACDPSGPAPAETEGPPEASATPSVTATATPTTDPGPAAARAVEPRFGNGCAELLDSDTINAALLEPASPGDFLTSEWEALNLLPRYASVAQDGGMLCEWSTGLPYTSAHSGVYDGSFLRVAILADARAGWNRYRETYAVTGSEDAYCTEWSRSCSVNFFTGGYWVSVEAAGVRGARDGAIPRRIATIVEQLRSAARAFGGPADAVTDPEFIRPSGTCDEIVPTRVVQRALGQRVDSIGGGGWSLYATARVHTEDLQHCAWFGGDGEWTVSMATLTGGEWLARSLLADRFIEEPLDLDRLVGTDAATIRCAQARGDCQVNLVVARNWIEFTIADTRGVPSSLRPNRVAGITELAQRYVDDLRG